MPRLIPGLRVIESAGNLPGRNRTPGPEGAHYRTVSVPAFTPDAVHRDAEATPA